MEIKNHLKNKKLLILFSAFLILGFLVSALALNFRSVLWSVRPLNPKTVKLGIITDIHAGNQDIRREGAEDDNVLFPSHFEKNVRSALRNMEDCDFILTLGDNLNRTSKKYAQKLLDITEGYPMIWTKGNHDEDKMFALFRQPKNYYYVDKGNWRIIVLDNGNIDHAVDYAKGQYIPRGYIEPEQVEWLKEALKTDKKIVVSMHVPVFDRFNQDLVYPGQEYLVRMFEKSGNVKYVFSGHFHVYDWHENINGIDYYILPSLELKDREGYFMKLELPNH